MKEGVNRMIKNIVVKKKLHDNDDFFYSTPEEGLRALTFIVFGGKDPIRMDKSAIIKRSLK